MFNCADHPFGLNGALFGWLPTAITAIAAIIAAALITGLTNRTFRAAPFYLAYLITIPFLSLLMIQTAWDCKGAPGTIQLISPWEAPAGILLSFVTHFPQRLVAIPLSLVQQRRTAFLTSTAVDAAFIVLYLSSLMLR